jgi:ParB/RepB/Spo0J family partition protein
MKKKLITAAVESAVSPAAVHNDGEFRLVLLKQIRISPDNRKRFNQAALQELAASIKADGVAQPILIRPVTPTPEQPEEYEIVAGERRFRASTIAELEAIPAMVRNLTDLQAAKLRILENLQRENPHPLEEAEGYELLMQQHGYNADQLADEIKKSRSYVYGRLKLCALSLDVREQFLDDKISASTALLIARIPLPALQAKALDEIINPKNSYPVGEPLSYRRAVEHLQQRYMLDLATAIFPLGDAKLLASAGSCVKCPKRTGNQPEIFKDVSSADVCTDPDCFAEKKGAHFARIVVAANKTGIPVIEAKEEVAALPNYWHARDLPLARAEQSIWYFQRNAPDTKNNGTAATHLTGKEMPPVAQYVKDSDGTVFALYDRAALQAALEAAGACETVEQHATRMGKAPDTPDVHAKARAAAAEAQRCLEEKADKETEFRIALYKRLRTKGATTGFTLEALREITKMAVQILPLPHIELNDVYTFDSTGEEAICAHIDTAGLPEIQLLLVDLLVGETLTVNHWDMRSEDCGYAFEPVLAMARHEGIDPDVVREEVSPAVIDTSTMQYDDLVKFIKVAPHRINELCKAVLADQVRFDLIDKLERAAKAAGYVYAAGGFVLPGAAAEGAGVVEPAAIETTHEAVPMLQEPGTAAAAEEATEDGLSLADLDTPVAKKKGGKKRLLPADAWPWPTRSEDPATPVTTTTEATPAAVAA